MTLYFVYFIKSYFYDSNIIGYCYQIFINWFENSKIYNSGVGGIRTRVQTSN